MATTKSQVRDALAEGDTLAEMVCLYRPHDDNHSRYSSEPEDRPLVQCDFEHLPEREFDEGFGGVEGEEVICFTKRHVYIKSQYDGAEEVVAIPRNPEDVGEFDSLPCVGGG